MVYRSLAMRGTGTTGAGWMCVPRGVQEGVQGVPPAAQIGQNCSKSKKLRKVEKSAQIPRGTLRKEKKLRKSKKAKAKKSEGEGELLAGRLPLPFS